MSMARLTEIVERCFNFFALRTISIQENAFINGQAFTHSDYTLTVADSNVTNYLFDASECTCSQVIAETPIFNATAGPVTIEYYVGTIVSAKGTELGVFNRRATSPNVPHAKLYITPTITGDGLRFAGQLLAATSAVQGDTGSATFLGLPFEVLRNNLVLIRVTNTNGENNIGRRFDWIES